MNDNSGKAKRANNADQEAILIALDQLSQTMEVMSQVVARLKRTVEHAQFANHRDSNPHSEQSRRATSSEQILEQYYQNKQKRLNQVSAETAKEPTVKAPVVIH